MILWCTVSYMLHLHYVVFWRIILGWQLFFIFFFFACQKCASFPSNEMIHESKFWVSSRYRWFLLLDLPECLELHNIYLLSWEKIWWKPVMNTESHLCKLLMQLLPLAVCLMWEGSEMKEGNGSSASTMSQPLYLSLPAPRTIWYCEKTPVKTGYENP